MVNISAQAAGGCNFDLAHLLKTLDLVTIIISQPDADAGKHNSTGTGENIVGGG